jgi:translocation and assembly module TamA
VRVSLETGGRYQFGRIEIEQDAISERLFAGYIRFAEGQPYSPERIRSTQFALEDSNYFSTITVIPGDRDPSSLTVPVTIRGEPIKRDRYSVALGYGTDTQVRGKFTWDNRRVNTLGHRSQIQVTASAIQSEAIARYIIPVGDPSLEKLEFSTAYINEEIGDLESERVEVVGGLTEAMGRWQRVLFLKLNQERSIFPDGTDETDLLLIPGASYASLPPNFLTGSAAARRRSGPMRRICASSRVPKKSGKSPDPGTCACAASSAQAGSTSSPSCPPRNASSPAATAACAASGSTSCRRPARPTRTATRPRASAARTS